MKTAMVFGAGTMGRGIAQVTATAGYRTYLCDVKEIYSQAAIGSIAAGLERQITRGKMTQERKDEILAHLIPTEDLTLVSQADLILEAVFENIEVKTKRYDQIEQYADPSVVIGTNTSFIPITRLAAGMQHPERLIGIHFFVPVYAMKLVEIILGEQTSSAAQTQAEEYVRELKKESVLIRNDKPGFIVNRINFATYAEAFRCLEEGVASVEDIDKAMRLGLNHPMGPFELCDYGGFKTLKDCFEILHELTGDDRYLTPKIIEEKLAKGESGKPAGKGFYDYRNR